MSNSPPKEKHRKALHLKGYDYSRPGAYFVTIVTKDRSCFFGDIVGEKMKANSAGEAIEHWWLELPRRFPTVTADEFVIMPNHIHGIIIMTGIRSARTGAPLPTIVQWFKTMSTNAYMHGVKNLGWTPFRGQLWQRSYYEHVIRGERSLNRIRQYILDNPARWEFDRESPAADGQRGGDLNHRDSRFDLGRDNSDMNRR